MVLDWLSDFQPSESEDAPEGYKKALEYAWRRFSEVTSASETLDKKADNLMRNAGLVAGLLGLAMNVLKINEPVLLVPAVFAFVVSLIFAAVACLPTGAVTTASVKDVLDDIGEGHASDAWIAASIHCAVEGRDELNKWKGRRLRIATIAFCLGLVCMLLPFLLLLLYAPKNLDS